MRGGDTTGLRAYNERLIMNALRRAGALSRAEIARETGLSGQAASVIVSRLIEAGLVVKREKVRGHVGQPSTPIAPNPAGAYSLGVKIGRHSVEALLVNLTGDVIGSCRERFPAPLPDRTIATVITQVRDLLGLLDEEARRRVIGVGIAMPGEIEAWATELDLAPGSLDGWRTADVPGALSAATGLEASLYNDATAACAAEMIAGTSITTRSALYVYMGTFIGGGVVLDGKLYVGEQANAGAIGSMPTGRAQGRRRAGQLIHCASVLQLERALEAAGFNSQEVLFTGNTTPEIEAVFARWMEGTLPEFARAVVAALSIIDFEAVVVDGLLPPAWRNRLTAGLEESLADFNLSGLSSTLVTAGSIGPMARVLGAAMLPLEARFSPDTDLLVRSSQRPALEPREAVRKAG
ncbi:putative NBD/HSP70 family sugar kinase [Breoghania corrubedonensis]|uniref:Putative NBD/HSP70 family sugar kinase n=1 Tax=Breoghania corrubedonensis TaxID=665038 RepID=A0A2T5VGX1_9HYPH|nr:ROK family transcriptional regulator [Breoghania corrubedonensis]PTW63002.1 putative NBD/HSP70 family sugar kinase [Breoghania corrubedonensis]